MRRASLVLILLILIMSLFLLSILSNILTGYPEPSRPDENEKERSGKDTDEEETSVLLFKVSPVTPQLYLRVWSADYYTGLNWLKTTDEKALEEFPQIQDANSTKVFTVEINATQQETFLPMASPNSTLADISLAPSSDLKFYVDAVGNVFKVTKHGQATETTLVYKISWSDVEVDDRLISLNSTSEEILSKYLQLPNVPIEVRKIAEDLEDPSYSVLDQILADVQFLKTDFVYDAEHSNNLYELIPQGSDISSYIEARRGICMDAATALALILRIQEIPARISIGYKPERVQGGKLLYYTTGAHALTEVYLPPYGWIQFDATPPLEENPRVKVLPFKKESSPGSRLFYQLSITNRCNSTGNFKLFVQSKQEWDTKAAPEEIRIEAFHTAEALVEVTIPEDVNFGEKNIVTVTVASPNHLKVASSILAIVQAENVHHIPTTTTLRNIGDALIRGDTFWLNGTVLTDSDEQVDNMTIFVFLTRDREAEGVIIGKGYSKQGNFQIESTAPHSVEIGDYKLIPVSLGTSQYAPSSSSDYIIKVQSTTIMELCSEEEFLLGYGAIHGRLLWDNETGIPNAPVSFEITSLATPSEISKLQNLTFQDGSFRIETIFESSGLHEVKAIFYGSEYVLGSQATRVIELKRELPTIEILGENSAIRGEVFNVTVAIGFEEIRVWGEPVDVAFDNQLLRTIETRENGSYTFSFVVDSEEELGSHILTCALERDNVSALHQVEVKSKTTLITEVTDIAEGILISFSASLFDDHDQPIQGAEIVVDNYGCSWKTGKDGNITFLLDAVSLWPEDLVLTAKFEGSELYLPVATEKEVALEPETSLPFLIPLVCPTLAVMVLMYVKHELGRQQAVQQTGDTNVVEEKVIAEEEPAYTPQGMQPLKIVLPDVEAPLPNVWGVKDKLRVEIVLDKSAFERKHKRDVEVLIDQETVAPVRLSRQGRAELSRVFIKKGEHKVEATLPKKSDETPLNAELKLRIVDYEEEIIRLYNEFLQKLSSHDIHVQKEMTAREIESLILRTNDFSSEALATVTTCFEKAKYSNHLPTREDYKTMFLSSRRLNNDI